MRQHCACKPQIQRCAWGVGNNNSKVSGEDGGAPGLHIQSPQLKVLYIGRAAGSRPFLCRASLDGCLHPTRPHDACSIAPPAPTGAALQVIS